MGHRRRVTVVERLQAHLSLLVAHYCHAVLREARDRHVSGRQGDLAAFVEEDRGVFLPENLLSPVFVVQPAEPDLGTVRQGCVPVGLVDDVGELREAKRHHLWKGVENDRGFDVVEPEPQDNVPALRCQGRSDNQCSERNEGLA